MDVEVVGRYKGFHPDYATDVWTICPLNMWFVHTIFTENPWIQIDLVESKDVAMVVVYNRQESAGKFNFEISTIL
jgi:hypothetical protein